MELTLTQGENQLHVTSQGAYIRELTISGRSVIAAQREVKLDDGTTRQRGGCHLCIPQFGPDASGEQPQHGYGRLRNWHIDQRSDDSVTLSLGSGDGSYAGLAAVVTYSLGARSLAISLALINKSETPLRVAPGIHPYFERHDGEVVELNDVALALEELAMTQQVGGQSHELRIGDRVYDLESDDLGTWALWTDDPSNYVCVEPTYAGYAFTREPRDDEILHPGEQRVYDFSIHWS